MNAARWAGDSDSSTTSNAKLSSSASAAASSGSFLGEGATRGSGSHGPTYVSRRRPAARNWSSASRVAVVVSQAGRSRGAVEASEPARCRRIHVSWATSSASARLPVIRYARETRRGRSAAKARASSSRRWSSTWSILSLRMPS